MTSPSGSGASAAPPPPHDVTLLLQRWSGGDRVAFDALAPLVYAELHRLARGQLWNAGADVTLQCTALVHEAWLKLLRERPGFVGDRHGFYALAATVMRHLVIDHVRARRAERRGGGLAVLSLDQTSPVDGQRLADRAADPDAEAGLVDLLALDEALQQLEALDPTMARVVELRFFTGLGVPEVAAALGLSERTVKREWAGARAWLLRALGHGDATRSAVPSL